MVGCSKAVAWRNIVNTIDPEHDVPGSVVRHPHLLYLARHTMVMSMKKMMVVMMMMSMLIPRIV